MAETIYLDHYRVCTDDQGAPEEVSRSGGAVNYKAVDLRSGGLVMLQLIPLAAIDPGTREQFEQRARTVQRLDHINIAKVHETGVENDRFVMASEYLAGDTADSWVITHGPIAPDAVFRAALQVIRAIAAAAFHGLTHRAIQPSNLMLLSDAAPEGGWPLVKLLNFGIAGVELHSESDEAREIAPSLPPQFASPEQLRGGEIDFRSEMYSLGATMCFLLTGAVPLAASGASVRARLRSLPQLRRLPRRFRRLLAHMLEENPNKRPQDPVVLEKEIQKALGVAQTHQPVRALTPVAPVLPEQPVEGPAPLAQVWRGVIAVAALLLLVGMAAVLLSSNAMPWRHRRGEIGKPVGVPERSTTAPAQPNNSAVAAVNQPPTPTNAAQNEAAQPEQTQPAAEAPVAAANQTSATAEATSRAPVPPNSSPNVQHSRTSAPAQVASIQSRNEVATENSAQTAASAPASVAAANASSGIAEAASAPAESNSTPIARHAEAAGRTSVARSDASNGARTEDSTETAPAEGPSNRSDSRETAAAEEAKAQTERTQDSSPAATPRQSSKKKTHVAQTTRKSRADSAALDPALAAEEDEAIRRAGEVKAQFVGTSADGRLLLRLPSGKIVTVRPRDEQEHSLEPRRHRRATEPEEYPRAEPVNPDVEPHD